MVLYEMDINEKEGDHYALNVISFQFVDPLQARHVDFPGVVG